MQDPSHDSPYTEGALRLHAIIRAVLSPGVWLVLAVQTLLIIVLQWRASEGASPLVAALAVVLPVTALLIFFYMQAGASHVLTLGRDAVAVEAVLRAGRKVFIAFVWLILKAGLLFLFAINILVLGVVLLSGADIESLMPHITGFFGPMMGLLGFVFAYWLPYVFVQPEFRLLPGLQAALRLGWARLSRSGFLALLIFSPTLAAAILPAGMPVYAQALMNLISGLLGWIGYIYCVDVLRFQPQAAAGENRS